MSKVVDARPPRPTIGEASLLHELEKDAVDPPIVESGADRRHE